MADFQRLVAATGRLEAAIRNNQAEMLAKMEVKIEAEIKTNNEEFEVV
jgi:hypothetical protein